MIKIKFDIYLVIKLNCENLRVDYNGTIVFRINKYVNQLIKTYQLHKIEIVV